jgi:hypothetical protein
MRIQKLRAFAGGRRYPSAAAPYVFYFYTDYDHRTASGHASKDCARSSWR